MPNKYEIAEHRAWNCFLAQFQSDVFYSNLFPFLVISNFKKKMNKMTGTALFSNFGKCRRKPSNNKQKYALIFVRVNNHSNITYLFKGQSGLEHPGRIFSFSKKKTRERKE